MKISLLGNQFSNVGGAYVSPSFLSENSLVTIVITLSSAGETSVQASIDDTN